MCLYISLRVASVLNNLGEVLRAWGHDETALPLLERALEVISSHSQSSQGHSPSPSIVPVLTNLAAVHRDADRHDRAEEIYTKARLPPYPFPTTLYPETMIIDNNLHDGGYREKCEMPRAVIRPHSAQGSCSLTPPRCRSREWSAPPP